MRYVSHTGYGYDMKHLNDIDGIDYDFTDAARDLDNVAVTNRCDLIEPCNADFGLLMLIPTCYTVVDDGKVTAPIRPMMRKGANHVLQQETERVLEKLVEAGLISDADREKVSAALSSIIVEHACFDYDSPDEWVSLV